MAIFILAYTIRLRIPGVSQVHSPAEPSVHGSPLGIVDGNGYFCIGSGTGRFRFGHAAVVGTTGYEDGEEKCREENFHENSLKPFFPK